METTFYIVRHGKTEFNEAGKVQGWCDSPLTAEGVQSARAMGRVLAPVDFAAAYSSDMGRTRQTLVELLCARHDARENAAASGSARTASSDAAVSRSAQAASSDTPAETPAAASAPASPGPAPSLLDPAAELAAFEAAAAQGDPFLIDGIPCRDDRRIREWCYGDLEGKSGMPIHARLKEGYGRELTFAEENERLPETADILAAHDASGRAERFSQIEQRLRSFLSDVGEETLAAGGGNVLMVTHSFAIRTLVYLFDRARVNDPLRLLNGSLTRISFDGKAFAVHEIGVLELPDQDDLRASSSAM